MDELKATDPLKRIDLNTGIFEANGTRYTIEGALTIERYAELQVLEKELGYGLTFKAMFDKLHQAFNLLNKQKPADAAVLLNDMIRGMVKIQEREPVVLKICALFMNTADEDRSSFSQDMYNRKIADWKAEKLDMRDFFTVASNSVNGYIEIYRTVSRIISTQPGSEIAAS
jgi:hypothetical protein